jgi:predicted DNA-binding WGR domain protein
LIVLRRIEPQRNMRRFYALSLQPDLFGTVSVVKEWGRIGQPGTVRHVVCAHETAARAALALGMIRRNDGRDLRGSLPSWSMVIAAGGLNAGRLHQMALGG